MEKPTNADVMDGILELHKFTEFNFGQMQHRIDSRFDRMQADMNRRFDRVDDRFDALEKRFDALRIELESLIRTALKRRKR